MGPPEDAYGRVTDPGRYAPLHATGRGLLAELEDRFAVRRVESTEHDTHGEGPAPVTTLVPSDPAAAPLTLVFTAFPGLLVRRDEELALGLPACGCDACDETLELCTDALHEYVEVLTAGAIGERLVHDDAAGPQGWWHETWHGTGKSSRSLVDGDRLTALRAALPAGERTWTAWPLRR